MKMKEGRKYDMIEINGKSFDWDIDKNLSNIRKHGISFKMAATSFFDPHAIIFEDEAHSQQENRFILIGLNKFDKLLTVCHCYRENNDIIRIFSARKATAEEKDRKSVV